jgi:hypothetical protein
VPAIAASGADPASPPKWRSLGPDGGWISALAIDPKNPSTIYAGARHNASYNHGMEEQPASPAKACTLEDRPANPFTRSQRIFHARSQYFTDLVTRNTFFRLLHLRQSVARQTTK